MKPAFSNVNIRMEQPLKEEAENLFHELGLNMTTAITMFIRQAVSLREIPFKVKAKNEDPFYSESNMRALSESIDQLERGEVVVKSADEIIKQLKKLSA